MEHARLQSLRRETRALSHLYALHGSGFSSSRPQFAFKVTAHLRKSQAIKGAVVVPTHLASRSDAAQIDQQADAKAGIREIAGTVRSYAVPTTEPNALDRHNLIEVEN